MKPEGFPWDVPESCFEAPDFWKSGIEECYEFVRGLPGMACG